MTALAGRGGAPAGVPTGNAYDKLGARNPVARRLVAGYGAALDELLWRCAQPRSLLDVGCGDGALTRGFAARLRGGRVAGVDLDDPALRRAWERGGPAPLELRVADARGLPFGDGEFDVVTALELLEHVQGAESALAELARVARRYVLASVPREPLWRMLNLARGAYPGRLGNTPGHVNGWSRRSFASLVSRHGAIEELRAPPPWTMVLVRVG